MRPVFRSPVAADGTATRGLLPLPRPRRHLARYGVASEKVEAARGLGLAGQRRREQQSCSFPRNHSSSCGLVSHGVHCVGGGDRVGDLDAVQQRRERRYPLDLPSTRPCPRTPPSPVRQRAE